MRIIDADELLKSVRESAKRAEEWLADCKAYKSNMTARAEQAILTFNECALRIKTAPTVDAVPVRCKDCKYWKTGEGVNRSKKVKFCTYNIGHHYARRDEDFCSRGERKDGDHHE